jgi:hypothetical protein
MTLINIIFSYQIIYYFQNQNLIEVVSPMEIFLLLQQPEKLQQSIVMRWKAMNDGVGARWSKRTISLFSLTVGRCIANGLVDINNNIRLARIL